jgi:hypothetical protein
MISRCKRRCCCCCIIICICTNYALGIALTNTIIAIVDMIRIDLFIIYCPLLKVQARLHHILHDSLNNTIYYSRMTWDSLHPFGLQNEMYPVHHAFHLHIHFQTWLQLGLQAQFDAATTKSCWRKFQT